MTKLKLELGVKTDPIEYRYTSEWLFRLMAEEGVRHLQLGTFFELYHLPDEYFLWLRKKASDFGIQITSLLTTHRELGGFFRGEPGWEDAARRNYRRLIEVGALLGARSVGSNPGTVPRDRIDTKQEGIAVYLRHMKELMAYAGPRGLSCLTIEPMSSLSEPPTLPDEIRYMAEELLAYHRDNPNTSGIGLCVDVSHGYADRTGKAIWSNMQLLDASLPYLYEVHLKNTDGRFEQTFGFSQDERKNGIVQIEQVRDHLLANAARIPVAEVIGYLEINGPKTGRDYSDCRLEEQLRASLRYLEEAFAGAEPAPTDHSAPSAPHQPPVSPTPPTDVQLAPSIMCCDLCRLEESVRDLEALGVDCLHLDIMDGRFTPNMPLGLEELRQLRSRTPLAFDAHLMVEDNDFFVRRMIEIGVQRISVHVESAVHLDRTLALIRDNGVQAGVALNPATPLSHLEYVIDRLDFVLIMTVNPGFAGQKLIHSALPKIAACRALLRDRTDTHIPIQVDGNVSFANIPRMVAAGADILVAGSSSLFHTGGSLRENLEKTRQAVAAGLSMREHESC